MRFSIIAIAATLLSTVLAQQAYPTAPIGSTKWNAGATVNIKWKLNPPAATAGLKVELLSGNNPQTQKVVANLGTGAPGATSLSVALPANLKSDFYTIRIGDSYSAYFLIQGSGPVPSGPAPTAGTATVGPVPTANTSTTITSTTGGAPVIPTTSTTTGAPKPTGNSAGFLKAGNVVPMAAAAAAVVLAMAF